MGKSLLWKQLFLLTDISVFGHAIQALNHTIRVPSSAAKQYYQHFENQWEPDRLFIFWRKIATWKALGPVLSWFSPIPLISIIQMEWKIWDTDNTNHYVQRLFQTWQLYKTGKLKTTVVIILFENSILSYTITYFTFSPHFASFSWIA